MTIFGLTLGQIAGVGLLIAGGGIYAWQWWRNRPVKPSPYTSGRRPDTKPSSDFVPHLEALLDEMPGCSAEFALQTILDGKITLIAVGRAYNAAVIAGRENGKDAWRGDDTPFATEFAEAVAKVTSAKKASK